MSSAALSMIALSLHVILLSVLFFIKALEASCMAASFSDTPAEWNNRGKQRICEMSTVIREMGVLSKT